VTQERVSSFERDQRVEASYAFHRDGATQTTVVYISIHRDEIAEDFFDWRGGLAGHDGIVLSEDLGEFERQRFGRDLEPALHGMLLFAVRRMLTDGLTLPDRHWTSNGEKARVEAIVHGLPMAQDEGLGSYLKRLAAEAYPDTAGLVPIKTMRHIETDDATLPYKDSDGPVPESWNLGGWLDPDDPDAEKEP
jgi:hypothetical protein